MSTLSFITKYLEQDGVTQAYQENPTLLEEAIFEGLLGSFTYRLSIERPRLHRIRISPFCKGIFLPVMSSSCPAATRLNDRGEGGGGRLASSPPLSTETASAPVATAKRSYRLTTTRLTDSDAYRRPNAIATEYERFRTG